MEHNEVRAMTLKPIWAFLVMQGYKDCENRKSAPKVRKGTIAVHVSASFAREEYDAVMSGFPLELRKTLPYEKLCELRGKVIGVIDYAVTDRTDSTWWDKRGKPIMLSNPRWLPEPFPECRGALQYWKLPPRISSYLNKAFGLSAG